MSTFCPFTQTHTNTHTSKTFFLLDLSFEAQPIVAPRSSTVISGTIWLVLFCVKDDEKKTVLLIETDSATFLEASCTKQKAAAVTVSSWPVGMSALSLQLQMGKGSVQSLTEKIRQKQVYSKKKKSEWSKTIFIISDFHCFPPPPFTQRHIQCESYRGSCGCRLWVFVERQNTSVENRPCLSPVFPVTREQRWFTASRQNDTWLHTQTEMWDGIL